MVRTKIIFSLPISPWIIGAFALLFLAAVIVWTLRDVARLKPLMRAALITLTTLGALLAIGLVMNPRLQRNWADPQKPALAVLVDDSRSMLLTDFYKGAEADWLREEQVKAAGAPPDVRANKEADYLRAPEAARAEIVRALLRQTPDSWLRDAADKFDVRLLRLSELAERVAQDGRANKTAIDLRAPGGAPSPRAQPLEDASKDFQVDEEGYSTAIGPALEQAAGGESGEKTPGAVVLISDCAWNSGRDPVDVAHELGLRGVPVYVIGLGNPEPPMEVSVLSLRGPPESLLGDLLFMEAQVLATSATPQRVTVELLDGGSLVAEKPVLTLPGARPVKVELSYEPLTPGRRTLTARIRPVEGQRVRADNKTVSERAHPANLGRKHAETTVEVVDRKIRVLLIDAEPRWEFRFIRSVLERDPGVVPTICLLRPGIGPIQGPGYLSALPTDKKGFADFDLVILGDVPRSLLPDAFLKELAEMVRVRGGAFALVAGRRQNYCDLAKTPLEDILPVHISNKRMPSSGLTVKPELTQEGAMNLMMRLSPTPEENEQAWANLPPMAWSADVGPLQRGATALLVNPTRLAGLAKQPILAVQYLGAGKTLFSGVEETWRWRKSIGDRYHYRFWAQAIRWLVRKHFDEGDKLCRISLSRAECNVNEKVEIEAYCLDRSGFPLGNAEITVLITPEKGASEPTVVSLTPAPGGWGLYRATFTPLKEGRYKFNPIVSAYGKTPLESKTVLQVTRPDLEKSYLAQDLNAAQAIAAASGGAYNSFADTAKLKTLLAAKAGHRIKTEEYAPFRNWIYYVILATVLSAAWFLRKRSGLA